MTSCRQAPQTFWLIQDARGAPSWIYIAQIYKTGHQFMQTQNPETALKFVSHDTCLNYINSFVQLQLEWAPVEYLRYSQFNWVRVVPNQNT